MGLFNESGACIVQRDFTVLLETSHSGFETARAELSMYAELIKTPATFHTYRITPLSLWNAAALGWNSERVIESLEMISRWNVPSALTQDVSRIMEQYGKLKLHAEPDHAKMCLTSEDKQLLDDLSGIKSISAFRMERTSAHELVVSGDKRGLLKQELTRLGYPVLDYAGYRKGAALSLVGGLMGMLQRRLHSVHTRKRTSICASSLSAEGSRCFSRRRRHWGADC